MDPYNSIVAAQSRVTAARNALNQATANGNVAEWNSDWADLNDADNALIAAQNAAQLSNAAALGRGGMLGVAAATDAMFGTAINYGNPLAIANALQNAGNAAILGEGALNNVGNTLDSVSGSVNSTPTVFNPNSNNGSNGYQSIYATTNRSPNGGGALQNLIQSNSSSNSGSSRGPGSSNTDSNSGGQRYNPYPNNSLTTQGYNPYPSNNLTTQGYNPYPNNNSGGQGNTSMNNSGDQSGGLDDNSITNNSSGVDFAKQIFANRNKVKYQQTGVGPRNYGSGTLLTPSTCRVGVRFRQVWREDPTADVKVGTIVKIYLNQPRMCSFGYKMDGENEVGDGGVYPSGSYGDYDLYLL